MSEEYMNEFEVKRLVRQVAKEAVDQLSKVPGSRLPIFDADDVPLLSKEPAHSFKSMGEFFKDVIQADSPGGHQSERLREWASKTAGYMEEGDLSQGGYTVPVEFRSQLLMTALEKSVVMPRATSMPMKTNRLELPALVDDDHSIDFYGGVTISRTAEGGQKSATNPEFAKVALTLHKITGMYHVNDELLEDTPLALETQLKAVFSQAIAFTMDQDFLSGDGVNKPLGAFNSANPSLIAISKETGQTANTIIYENIIKMWAQLYPAGEDNAVWVANKDCFPQLATLNLAVGTGGIPVFQPANQAAGVPYRALMGRPLIFSEKMETLGDQGDIGLADFSQYLIGARELKTAISIHLRFDYDQTSFRFVMRYDGQPWWLSTLTPLKSSSELSPFIVLEARA